MPWPIGRMYHESGSLRTRPTRRENELRPAIEMIAKARNLEWEISVYGEADYTNTPGTIEGLMHEIAHLAELRAKHIGSSGIGRAHAQAPKYSYGRPRRKSRMTPETSDMRETRACAIEVLALRKLGVPIDSFALAETSAKGMNLDTDPEAIHREMLKHMKTPRCRKLADDVVRLVISFERIAPKAKTL